MKPIFLLLTLAFTGFSACSPDADPPSPPVNEFLVVGNDKGFRDDYISQANIITINDSALTVRSLRSVDNARVYPIVNGYLEGGSDPTLHWRFSTIGQDTITLTDTSRASTFYLHRLRRVDSIPEAIGLLTSGELNTGGNALTGPSDRSNYVFNDMGQSAGCLINRSYRGYRDWTKMVGNSENNAVPDVEYYVRNGSQSSLWRLYGRFAQPILIYDNYKKGMTVIPLDSVSLGGDTLYGRSVTDRSFRFFNNYKLVRVDTSAMRLSADVLAALPATPDCIELMPLKASKRHRRRWEEIEGMQNALTIYEEDLEGLRLEFSGTDKIAFSNGGETLVFQSYRFHETASYLVVGDECDTGAYWHYKFRGDSLTFRIPLRVEVVISDLLPQVMEINGKEVTVPAGRWYVDEEWRATYFIGEEESR
ncbi:MAG: hypothetical protein ACJATN_002978 [Neolewinella sp.]|jgi:hypothetical protein